MDISIDFLILGYNIIDSFKSKASDEEMTAAERLLAYRDEVQNDLYGEECEIELDLNQKVRAVIILRIRCCGRYE